MKFGVREICDVVLKAKAKQTVGNKTFFKGEPVCYFDSLKTSSMEAAATTVYAQGGRGNARLVAWEGERTVTFTMEDALISPEGFMLLSGAGLIDASKEAPVLVHTTQVVAGKQVVVTESDVKITLDEAPATDANAQIFVMTMKDGEVSSEPFVGTAAGKVVTIKATESYVPNIKKYFTQDDSNVVLVDFYVAKQSHAQQIEITPDKFGGNYYLEASTLFRDTDGVDMPAEFIIPNCKIQSNFTFTMASSGDPSTFTFTMDAFPDYTKFDPTKKVLSVIQIVMDNDAAEDEARTATDQGDKAEDVTAANLVNKEIEALKAPSELNTSTSSENTKVTTARGNYNKLTRTQKNLVLDDNKQKLEDCEYAMAQAPKK